MPKSQLTITKRCNAIPGSTQRRIGHQLTFSSLKETLRLYSPSWLIFRRLTEPREVCGYLLPAGAVTLFSAWVVHHDPLWWPDPDEFRPERWLWPVRVPE